MNYTYAFPGIILRAWMICVLFCFNVWFNPRQRCWASPWPRHTRDMRPGRDLRCAPGWRPSLCWVFSETRQKTAWHMPLTGETHWLNTAVSTNTTSVLVFSGVLLDISCSFKIFIEKGMCLESELKPRPLGVWGAVWVALSVHGALKVYEYVCAI